MDKNYTIKEEETVSKCAWTPYKNWEIKGQVVATYVRGQKVYEDNKFSIEKSAPCRSVSLHTTTITTRNTD